MNKRKKNNKRADHTVCKIIHAANRAKERYNVDNIFKLETAIRVIISNRDNSSYLHLGDSQYIFRINKKEYCVVYQAKSQTLVTFLPPKTFGTLAKPDYSKASNGIKKEHYNFCERKNHLSSLCEEIVLKEKEYARKEKAKLFTRTLLVTAYEHCNDLIKSNNNKFGLIESLIYLDIIETHGNISSPCNKSGGKEKNHLDVLKAKRDSLEEKLKHSPFFR